MQTNEIKGDFMATGMHIVYGFLFGVGLILASAAMRVAFHITFCG